MPAPAPAPVPLQVTVEPASAVLTPGATMAFEARVTLSNGEIGSSTVIWTSTGGTITSSGLYRAGSTAGSYRVIATSGVVADTASVVVTVTTLAVRASGVPDGSEKWLLQDTDSLQPACPSDVVIPFTAASQPVAAVWPGCRTELSLFSTEGAPVLDVAPTIQTSVAGSVILEQLPPTRAVKVRVFYQYDAGDLVAESDRQLSVSLFQDNAMGVDLIPVGAPTYLSPTPDPATGKLDPRTQALTKGCAGIAARPELAEPGSISVYLIAESLWPAEWRYKYGFDCYEWSYPNVVFLREAHVPATLVHELGHALGLRHAGWGFQLAYYGWSDDNIMQDSAFDPGSPRPISGFTLGQVYRANFDGSAWLNASGLRTGVVKTCQPSEQPGASGVDWQCPDVRLDRP